jgi:hypothetical protein
MIILRVKALRAKVSAASRTYDLGWRAKRRVEAPSYEGAANGSGDGRTLREPHRSPSTLGKSDLTKDAIRLIARGDHEEGGDRAR